MLDLSAFWAAAVELAPGALGSNRKMDAGDLSALVAAAWRVHPWRAVSSGDGSPMVYGRPPGVFPMARDRGHREGGAHC